jgi:hypothetical protein
MAAWRSPDDYPKTRLRDTGWRDWLPVAVIAVLCVLVIATGWHV